MSISIEQIAEIRNWILLTLATIGAILTLRTFIDNTRQRRLDNTYKTLDYLREHISSEQIETLVKLFHANNPLAGFPKNEFHFGDNKIDYIETMFSEGGCGNGDIHNMILVFNLVSPSLQKKDLVEILIWYEYGQLMRICYNWTEYLEKNKENEIAPPRQEGLTNKEYKKSLKGHAKFIEDMYSFFFEFNNYMKGASERLSDKPTKYYTYIE